MRAWGTCFCGHGARLHYGENGECEAVENVKMSTNKIGIARFERMFCACTVFRHKRFWQLLDEPRQFGPPL
jgi:hypothetical protein